MWRSELADPVVLSSCCWSAADNVSILSSKTDGRWAYIEDISARLSTIRRNPKKLQMTGTVNKATNKSDVEDVY
jgi:hypothetical protein